MSSLLKILSDIDPTATPKSPVLSTRQTQTASVPRPAPHPNSAPNGTAQNQPSLKRKADSPSDGAPAKVQRKEGASSTSARPNGASRPAALVDVTKPKAGTPTNVIPYRGTAGSGGMAKAPLAVVKKQSPSASGSAPVTKPTVLTPKSTIAAANAGPTTVPAKPSGGYAALLQKAKAQQAKPSAPLAKVEPTRILTKKERDALRAERIAAAKGKRTGASGPTAPAKSREGSSDLKEKRKPTQLGYQGTARPIKKPAEIGYKGTARPQAHLAGPAGRAGSAPAAKPKSKMSEGRYSGYADWDDLDDMDDDMDDDEEESESDMEGGLWDVEQEEQLALKAARKEDAEAAAEEMELKRQKEERKRKLTEMSKAAAAKRKY
ncbi:hypothetical protein K491DRAFT_686161 [Lophiostoma macrostomum CBS 122681]|uniref:SPT2-domain-containing protein n=1 Tax=Lophiostoma macrostomum CBS 122681 TaxID=1314788 RepID=A0A6A6TVJ2_9PLEO|nr:hypothetical protein K491DRAFT_686161 [Lophiostoma macrostomum CBS 122681]